MGDMVIITPLQSNQQEYQKVINLMTKIYNWFAFLTDF